MINNKSKKRILICGCFAFDTMDHGGQPVKTRELYWALKEQLNENPISFFETKNWKKKPLSSLIRLICLIVRNDILIMLPANNGLKIFSVAFFISKKCLRKDLHYVVIGGWLPDALEQRRFTRFFLQVFDGIYVETSAMKNRLEIMGFNNIEVMPNFKSLNVLKKEELVFNARKPFKICTFSRVTPEKGIEDAIIAADMVNRHLGYKAYDIDVFGEIEKGQEEWFNELVKRYSDFLSYKGVIDYKHSTDVLKNYYLLLFPTYYSGEGFAGTILDAMAAGLPVVATDWRYNSEIIHEGINGFLCEPNNPGSIARILETTLDTKVVERMKSDVLYKAYEYLPENTIKILINKMGML